MAVIRTMVAGLGGIAGFVSWALFMTAAGMWPAFLAALYDNHAQKRLMLFVGSLLLCGYAGGALVLFLGERFHLFPSRDELDRQAKPISLFSREDSGRNG